jgi:hypothetical protein
VAIFDKMVEEGVVMITVQFEHVPAELSIHLGVTAVVEPTLGVLQVAGQLTPRSFLLSPSCRNAGGFALCYWYGPSPHAGDWVFTVGDNHAANAPLAHYPGPPRLEISWRYDTNLYVGGQAYFAIAPAVYMGGGRQDTVFGK